MPIQERKSTITPSRRQVMQFRKEVKANLPKRRLATETLKANQFTKENIKRLIRKILSEQKHGIYKKDPKIIGIGNKKIAYRIGPFLINVNGKYEKKYYVLKFRKVTDKEIEIFGDDPRYGQNYLKAPKDYFKVHFKIAIANISEAKIEYLTIKKCGELGIPITNSDLIILNENNLSGFLIQEDLTQNNRFVVNEYHKFDFSQIKNGNKLKEDFQIYFKKLINSKVKISSSQRHYGKSTLREEIERSFFIVVDPITKIGRLVLGDADQIEF